MDHEALDLLLARGTPVVPALQFEYASIEKGPRLRHAAARSSTGTRRRSKAVPRVPG